MANKEELKILIEVALGKRKADLVIKNTKIVDVINAKTIDADIAIVDGKIAGIGSYQGIKEVDAKKRYASAGLIDSHIHIESSYCSPEEFARMVVPHGTTTVIADPHEIVNVCGIDGFNYMVRAAEKTELSVRYMVPSCVPATKFEDAGAIVNAYDMKWPMSDRHVPGLGEFMDYKGILECDDDVLEKIITASKLGKIIDGHSPCVSGNELNAYISAGIRTDHECSTIEEMQERLERGMYIQLRHGSACHDLENLMGGITKYNFRRCLLCSDDRQPKTIFEEGHLEEHLRMLVRAGISPFMAIAMATINPAECYGLTQRGIIAPGKRADIVLFDDLKDFKVSDVFIEGVHVAATGKYLLDIEKTDISLVRGSMHVKDFSIEKLKLNLKSDTVYAIEMVPGGVLSKKAKVKIKLDKDGDFIFNPNEDVVKCAVLERHHSTGKVGLGFIKDYGIKHGAIAASVAHDSHNIICVGVSNEEMELAIKKLIEQEGGFVIVKDGKVLENLPLPIAGLMSDMGGEWVSKKLSSLHEIAFKELGITGDVEPIMTLTFMSLIVIPELKITARGLFDVCEYEFIDIEAV